MHITARTVLFPVALGTKSLVLGSVATEPLDVVHGKGSKLYYDSSSDHTGTDRCVSHKPVEAIPLVLPASPLGKHHDCTPRERRLRETPQGQGAVQVKVGTRTLVVLF